MDHQKNIMVDPIIQEKVDGSLLTWDQMDTSKVRAKTECFQIIIA